MFSGNCLFKTASDKDTQSLEVVVLDGAVEEQFKDIDGTMDIAQGDGVLAYELNYKL